MGGSKCPLNDKLRGLRTITGSEKAARWSCMQGPLSGRGGAQEVGEEKRGREGRTKKWPDQEGRRAERADRLLWILPETLFIYITQKKSPEKYHSLWTKRASSNGRIQNSRGFNVYFYICLYQKMLHFVWSVGYSQKATTSRHLVWSPFSPRRGCWIRVSSVSFFLFNSWFVFRHGVPARVTLWGPVDPKLSRSSFAKSCLKLNPQGLPALNWMDVGNWQWPLGRDQQLFWAFPREGALPQDCHKEQTRYPSLKKQKKTTIFLIAR